MYNGLMISCLVMSIFLGCIVVSYALQVPLVVLIEGNEHRINDLVCLPNGVECE